MPANSGFWAVLKTTWPPKPTFKVEQIPDLSGRVVIVTGGNVGIGYETTKVLLEHNAKVYVAARSKERAETAIKSLKESTGKQAIFLQLDLADLASVKRAAEEFLSKESELHILFNNAGVMNSPVELLTKDGYDMQFGTNVIGHFFFTELLMPALVAGVQSSPDKHTRVVTTSSNGAYMDTLHWDTFKDTPERKKKPSMSLYFQSKFANVVVARQVAKRYADKGVISISVHPGGIRTELGREMSSIAQKIAHSMMYPAPFGALTQLFAGTMPEALNYSGEFMLPWARLGKCRPEAYDDEIGERLWQWLQKEVEPFRT